MQTITRPTAEHRAAFAVLLEWLPQGLFTERNWDMHELTEGAAAQLAGVTPYEIRQALNGRKGGLRGHVVQTYPKVIHRIRDYDLAVWMLGVSS